MISLNRHTLCSSILLLSLGPGCSTGGQTGEESQEPCDETKLSLLQDEVSPLGFGPQEMRIVVGNGANAELHWLPTSDFSYGPESGSSTLSLNVLDVGAARFVESEVHGGGSMELMPICQDRVELDVTLSAATNGGAFAEEFDATLVASTYNDVWLTHLFDPTVLSGAFAVDASSLGTRRFIRLTFEAHWSTVGLRGLVAVGLEQTSSSDSEGTTAFRNVPVGCFGSGSFDPNVDCMSIH